MYKKSITVENLKSLYDSELYQDLLSEFVKRSNIELDNDDQNSKVLHSKLVHCQRHYHFLNQPFEVVLSAFEKNRDKFLDYQIAATDFFSEKDKNIEFGLTKSDLMRIPKTDRIYLLERFCEFYLLQSGNRERLISYLGAIKVLYIGKYAEQITILYRKTFAENVLSQWKKNVFQEIVSTDENNCLSLPRQSGD